MKPEGWAVLHDLRSRGATGAEILSTAQNKKPGFGSIQANLPSWLSLSFPICETETTCCLISLTLGLREVIYLFLT